MKIFNLISFSVLICYFGTITAQVPTNGLAGYWPFNGNANDESGNENNGTTYGVSSSSDRFGRTDSAYIFDGIDDYIEIADDKSLDLDTAVTMSAWINFSSYPTYSDGHVWTSIINKRNAYILSLEKDMGTTVTIKDSQFKGFWQNTSIQEGFKLNKWYHIVGLFNENTTESKLYINGLLINSYPRTDGMPTNLNITDDVLRIGNELFSNGSNVIHFPGLIDDVRVFNRSLSENEIKLLYHENDYSVLDLNTSVCNKYELNDIIYKTSGNYTQNLINHMGGDSLIRLNLIITSIDTSVTLINGEIIATEQNANYKWLDCENNIIMQDATSNSFTPQESGVYSVIISKNNCIDTSYCKSISISDINETDKASIEIFPNPVDNKLIIQSSEMLVKTSIRIQNQTGALIRNFYFENTRNVELDLNIPSGIYLLIITDNLGRNITHKFVKQ